MGLERRGRAGQDRPEVNPAGEEPRERPKPKVKSFEIRKRLVYRGVGEGPGQRRGAGRGRRQHRPSSKSEERDNLYKLWNRMIFGELLPWAGAGGGDTEGSRGRGQGSRGAEHGGPGCPDRSSDAAGGEAGADLPPRQLRLPSGPLGP